MKTSVAVKDEVLPFAICARSTNKNGNKERELAWAQASWSEEGVLSTTQESCLCLLVRLLCSSFVLFCFCCFSRSHLCQNLFGSLPSSLGSGRQVVRVNNPFGQVGKLP